MPHPTPASALPSDTRPSVVDWRQLRKRLKPWLQFKVVAGGGVLVLFLLASIFAEWVAPFDPNRQNLMKAMTPPEYFFGPHFLGTDHVGRDILSRCIFGARVSLAIALAVVVISGAVGVLLGVVSGYFGKYIDFGIQKIVEVMWAFPPLLLAIAVLAFLGQGLSILIMALTLQRWIPFCRVTRANALTLKEREFVTAARSLGATHTRIIFKHLLPNLMQSALVIGTFAMASAIIAEAALSFLGLGVPPPSPHGAACWLMVVLTFRPHGGWRCFPACAFLSLSSRSTCWATPFATILIPNSGALAAAPNRKTPNVRFTSDGVVMLVGSGVLKAAARAPGMRGWAAEVTHARTQTAGLSLCRTCPCCRCPFVRPRENNGGKLGATPRS